MTRVIKEGDLFLFTDDQGDLPGGNAEGLGLYTKDTRFLSRLEWSWGEIPIRLLSAEADGAESRFRYSNGSHTNDGETLNRDSVEILRERWIFNGTVYESFLLTNYGRQPLQSDLSFTFDADFADMFVIRGYKEARLGEKGPTRTTEIGLIFTYRGTDEVERSLEIQASPEAETDADRGIIRVPVRLDPGGSKKVHLRYIPVIETERPEVVPAEEARNGIRATYREWFATCPEVESDLEVFNALYRRSLKDMRMLITDVGYGGFPVAGLPWFAVPFGRDSLIAAWQSLPVDPGMAKATVRTLARYQGTQENPYRDEEPGKILHEIRYGELAMTERIPHTPYYGTIDATPLFLILIAEVYRWTGDLDFVHEHLPHVQKALEWIDRYGDPDRSGYVSYHPRSEQAIVNQGWKDSDDSVVHKDGRMAEPPVALAEVQGYVYMAKQAWSRLFHWMGNVEESRRLAKQAADLKQRFARDFWMEEEQYPAIALDGRKERVEMVTSNPGHCLLAGLLPEEQAERVARRLLAKDLSSGWGIRTLSTKDPSYNPFSYHNGSVWPHDNSLILLGLKRRGFREEAAKIMEQLLAAARQFPDIRLPELYCGYSREEGKLVSYPVACSPQAWAAGTGFVLLQAMLGLDPDADGKTVMVDPQLPEGMNRLTVRRLPVGKGSIDLRLVKHEGVTHVRVERNTSGWTVRF